jgi:hypothetical protein
MQEIATRSRKNAVKEFVNFRKRKKPPGFQPSQTALAVVPRSDLGITRWCNLEAKRRRASEFENFIV